MISTSFELRKRCTSLTSDLAKDAWPELNWPDWQDTGETLHRWTQIIGKVRMALSPMMNQWWQVTLYVSSRGLTTSPIPHGAGWFDVAFDFIDHELVISRQRGKADPVLRRTLPVGRCRCDRMLLDGLDAAQEMLPGLRGQRLGGQRLGAPAQDARPFVCAPFAISTRAEISFGRAAPVCRSASAAAAASSWVTSACATFKSS